MDELDLALMAKQLLHYVTTLRRGEEPKDHPTPEWLGKFRVLADQHLSGSGLLLPGQTKEPDLGVQLAVYELEISSHLAQIEALFEGMQIHEVLDEVAPRQSVLDRRERERELRVGMFVNEYASNTL